MNLVLMANLTIFAIIALAALNIGKYFTRMKLPLITGYLLLGMLAGPYGLGLIEHGMPESLRFVDEISLAFIAFAAGRELYLKELQSRLKSISWVIAGLVIVTFTLGSLSTFFLSSHIPFTRNLPAYGRLAIALLVGSILSARSPSSMIAIINELRAKGPFTKTALGVTVIMDVVVIVIFAINSSIAEGLLLGAGFDLFFLGLLVAELAIAALAGYLLGKFIHLILSRLWSRLVKTALILLSGYAVYLLSEAICLVCELYLPFEIFIEPLLVCMIAGFLITNTSPHRDEFNEIIHHVSPAIYVVFFTLTGASLNLSVLAQTWQIALVLFSVRLLGIFIGSWSGGTLAGEPQRVNKVAWMAYVTQAGVGLGLAKNVAVEFPTWGNDFATIMISVIVINQIIGPPLFKAVIRLLGESHLPADAQPDEFRDVLILGIEGQSLTLARQLFTHNWQVILADTDKTHVDDIRDSDVSEAWLPEINYEHLSRLVTKSTDALVAMLPDDAQNLRACELAYEKFGIPRLVVRLNDLNRYPEFNDLGVMVVNPASAMVSLLDQFVRAPQSAEMLMHRAPNFEMLQVTISDPDIAGKPLRELRLPDDTLVISVMRDHQSIVPHGYTILHMHDEVTLVGNPASLETVTLKLGY